MRKIITAAFVSLDGVMQAPGGPDEDRTGGFAFGGWVAPHWDEVLGAKLGELFDRRFDLLLGRRTYDIFAAYWPYQPTDPAAPGYEPGNAAIARTFNRVTKYVASRSNPRLDWENSQLLEGDVVAALRALKQSDGPDLLTQGSSDLLRTLWAADLVDELRVHVFPLVLGKGKRLFGDGAAPRGLRLTGTTTSPSGVVVASYAPAGAVPTGSFVTQEPSDAEVRRRAEWGA